MSLNFPHLGLKGLHRMICVKGSCPALSNGKDSQVSNRRSLTDGFRMAFPQWDSLGASVLHDVD